MIDARLRALLQELEEEGRRNDEREQERSKKMLNLEPETAQLLNVMVHSSKRTRILEIGTSNGYSTIWLAEAARANGGRATSIDREAHKQELAAVNLERAGLRDAVELLHGDATEVVGNIIGPFDCVFFDADRYSAPAQLERLLPKLTPDVLLFADNALSHPDEIAGYLQALERLPDFERLIVPVGKGLSIAYRAG